MKHETHKPQDQVKQQSDKFDKVYVESKFYQQKERGIIPFGLRAIYDHINQSLQIKPGQKTVEIGCGNARLISLFGCQRFGVDISLQGLISAKSNTDGYFVQSNAEILPFANESFDVILCCEVLEHLPDDIKALTEIYRILKPAGKLLLSVPAEKLFPLSLPWFEKKIFGKLRIDKESGHLRCYNSLKLQDILRENGFQVLNSDYIIGLCLSSCQRIFIGRGGKIKDQYTKKPAVPVYLKWLYESIYLLSKIDRLFSSLGGDSIFILAQKD